MRKARRLSHTETLSTDLELEVEGTFLGILCKCRSYGTFCSQKKHLLWLRDCRRCSGANSIARVCRNGRTYFRVVYMKVSWQPHLRAPRLNLLNQLTCLGRQPPIQNVDVVTREIQETSIDQAASKILTGFDPQCANRSEAKFCRDQLNCAMPNMGPCFNTTRPQRPRTPRRSYYPSYPSSSNECLRLFRESCLITRHLSPIPRSRETSTNHVPLVCLVLYRPYSCN
jgi:hypothetical protein